MTIAVDSTGIRNAGMYIHHGIEELLKAIENAIPSNNAIPIASAIRDQGEFRLNVAHAAQIELKRKTINIRMRPATNAIVLNPVGIWSAG